MKRLLFLAALILSTAAYPMAVPTADGKQPMAITIGVQVDRDNLQRGEEGSKMHTAGLIGFAVPINNLNLWQLTIGEFGEFGNTDQYSLSPRMAYALFTGTRFNLLFLAGPGITWEDDGNGSTLTYLLGATGIIATYQFGKFGVWAGGEINSAKDFSRYRIGAGLSFYLIR